MLWSSKEIKMQLQFKVYFSETDMYQVTVAMLGPEDKATS